MLPFPNSPRLRIPAALLLLLLLLLPLSPAGVPRARAQSPASPWLTAPWTGNLTIPPGNYLGPRGALSIGKDSRITWAPGSQVENLNAEAGTGTPITATGCLFRKVSVGLSLWSRLDLTDCLLDSCSFRKINPWYDTRNSSTKWRFTNCVIAKSFMGGSFSFLDCSVRAVNCTFLDVKMPAIHYRDGKAAEQAQQQDLKFENCRFVNCEINERFLAATVNCVFENCRYTGTEKKFATAVNAPLEVKAYWSGKNAASSYTRGHLTVSFLSTAPSLKTGSALAYVLKDSRLTMTGISPPGSLVTLGALTAPPAASAPEPKPDSDSPSHKR